MFVEENSASIYLQRMRDRSMRSGTKFAWEIQLTDWSTAGNLSNRSSGVQIPRDICTRFGRYLYSRRCSWIIKYSCDAQVHMYCTMFLTLTDSGCIQPYLHLYLIEERAVGVKNRAPKHNNHKPAAASTSDMPNN